MALKYCPRCMRTQADPLRCDQCGFTAETYEAPQYALPVGTEVGPCTIGIVLGISRQAICYSAMDTRTGDPVLLEELFPTAAVKREGKNAVQSNPEARWAEAVERFAGAKETDRKNDPILVIRENQTAYRVYPAKAEQNQTPEDMADALLDHPIRFRDEQGKPLFSINALPIPPLPAETKYTGGSDRKPRKKWLAAAGALLLIALAGAAAWKLGWLKSLFP